MANRRRYTAAQVIHALNINKGMVFLAAKSLGCSHVTVYRYAKRYKSVQRAIDANRGDVIDVAELKLYDAILAGEHWAVAFALKTIGKHRGYVEKQALDLMTGEKKIHITVTYDGTDGMPSPPASEAS